jgi:hypothetical protein
MPAIVTALVAIAGIAGIAFDDFGASNASRDDSDKARMITAAAVSRAGATEIPSELSISSPISPPG